MAEALHELERAAAQAFLVAHLLTADVRPAEEAVLAAIESYDADEDTAETLLEHTIRAALWSGSGNAPAAIQPGCPIELEPVLRLPETARHCFVLRILVRYSREACARLMNLKVHSVDAYTCAALQGLSSRAAASEFSGRFSRFQASHTSRG